MAGVYISYPFCAQKCTFCNFASGVFTQELERNYLAALEAEIAAHQWAWTPETVYLGGGTPSRIAAADLTRLLDRIPGRPWKEATMEAAPGTLTADGVAGWRAAGITRVSLGVQSFVTAELRQTGRPHDAAIVARDVAMLRDAGIDDINLDLIAGLAGQTRESWAESLDWIERLRPTHVSVYIFEVDEDSRLGLEVLDGGRRYGAGAVPSEELVAEMYQTAKDRLAQMGLARYEISNFARAGFESRHNLKYWRLEPYVGFGSDAHSFDGEIRRANVEVPAEYVRRWQAGQAFVCEHTKAHPEEERFFIGLRLAEGVNVTRPERARYERQLERFFETGMLEWNGSAMRLTDRGVLLSNEILQEFVG